MLYGVATHLSVGPLIDEWYDLNGRLERLYHFEHVLPSKGSIHLVSMLFALPQAWAVVRYINRKMRQIASNYQLQSLPSFSRREGNFSYYSMSLIKDRGFHVSWWFFYRKHPMPPTRHVLEGNQLIENNKRWQTKQPSTQKLERARKDPYKSRLFLKFSKQFFSKPLYNRTQHSARWASLTLSHQASVWADRKATKYPDL